MDWDLLVTSVRSSASVDSVAFELNLRLSENHPDHAGSSAVREALASVIRETVTTERQRTITRISAVLERLSPEARSRLMTIDPASAPAAFRDLTDLVEAVDASELMATLQAISDSAKLVCSESVRLLGSIARMSRSDSHLTDNLLQVIRRATGEKAAGLDNAHARNSGILGSIAELLERSSATAINPEDYDRLLDTLVAEAAPLPDPVAMEPIRSQWTDEKLHAALLVADLAASPDTLAHDAAALFSNLSDSFEFLIASGQIKPLLTAAAAADRVLSGPHTPGAVAPVKAFLLSLQTPERLSRMLDAAPPGSPAAVHAVEFIRALGTDALLTALRVTPPGSPPRTDLASLLHHPAINAAAVLASLARSNEQTAAALMRTNTLAPALQAALAALLIESTDPASVEDAVNALYHTAHTWTESEVQRAIEQSSDRCRLQGIDRARALPREQALRVLEPCIQLPRSGPVPVPILAAATTVLCAAGPDGLRCLIRACGRLLRRPTPRRWLALQAIFDTITAQRRSGNPGFRSVPLLGRVILAAFAADREAIS